LVANIIEAGADIGAIAASCPVPAVPVTGITVGIALLILVLQTWASYQLLQKFLADSRWRYSRTWGRLSAKPHLSQFVWPTFLPKIHFTRDYLAMLVALIGTRLSPYLYFWESSQKVEQQTIIGRTAEQSTKELRSAAWDVNAGMFFSNLIMYFVILSTAATLFQSGHRSIQTAGEAAEALRPLAGRAASLLFALGIIGAGALTVPVLTTGPAHALAEMFGWSHGLRKHQGRSGVLCRDCLVDGRRDCDRCLRLQSHFSFVLGFPRHGVAHAGVDVDHHARRQQARDHGRAHQRGWLKLLGWVTTAAVTLAALP
jgi:Mn2+/Fe2+ NRAMP family transporter